MPKPTATVSRNKSRGSASARLVVLTSGAGDMPTAMQALVDAASPSLKILRTDSLAKGLAHKTTLPVVMLLANAETVLGDMLANGSAPAIALDIWMAEAKRHLDEIKKAGNRVLLLDPAAVSGDPQECARHLTKQLNIRFGKLSSAMIAPVTTDVQATPYRILAAALLTTNPQAVALASELQGHISGPIIARLGDADRAQEAIEAAHADLLAHTAMQAEEVRGLGDGLTQLQDSIASGSVDSNLEKLETQAAELRVLSGNVAQLQDFIESGSHDAHLVQSAMQADELRILGDNITQLQDFIESGTLDAYLEQSAVQMPNQKSVQMVSLRRQRESVLGAALLEWGYLADARQIELEAVYKSRSWRVLEPLRVLRRRLRRR